MKCVQAVKLIVRWWYMIQEKDTNALSASPNVNCPIPHPPLEVLLLWTRASSRYRGPIIHAIPKAQDRSWGSFDSGMWIAHEPLSVEYVEMLAYLEIDIGGQTRVLRKGPLRPMDGEAFLVLWYR